MTAERNCPTCGQALPPEARRDPPLPPLTHPNVLTIHDLPEGVKPVIRIEPGKGNINGVKCAVRRLIVPDPSLLTEAVQR